MPDWEKEVPKEEKKETSTIKVATKMSKEDILSKCLIGDWTKNDHESIMIFGGPKVGKTWACMHPLEQKIKAGGHVFIVSTDDGLTRTFKAYFTPEQQKEMLPHITFYYVGKLDWIFTIIADIMEKQTGKDLVLIDLISEFWEMAQAKFVEDAAGDSPTDYVLLASKDSKKFGLLEGTKWQYIKRIDSFVRKSLILKPRCDVIGLCSEKDIEAEKAIKKQQYHKFDITGAKPGGAKDLMHDFNTIVYLGMLPNNKRFFQVVGDRGNEIDPTKRIEFDRDFYPIFKEIVKR